MNKNHIKPTIIIMSVLSPFLHAFLLIQQANYNIQYYRFPSISHKTSSNRVVQIYPKLLSKPYR